MIELTKSDYIWNYLASFLKIGSSALLLPLILSFFNDSEVGVYYILITVNYFAALIDFGFTSTFSRNVTYCYSGVKTLYKKGYDIVDDSRVNYDLLKALIKTMKRFYLASAIVFFLLIATLGLSYFNDVIVEYKGDVRDAKVAFWVILLANTYGLYSQYYAALIVGKGMIQEQKKAIVSGQILYLVLSMLSILLDFGLTFIMIAHFLNVILTRFLMQKSMFTNEFKSFLDESKPIANNNIFEQILPNAVKVGLTSLGGFIVARSSLLFAGRYLGLNDVASWGVTLQIFAVIAALSSAFYSTLLPKISHLRITGDNDVIKTYYIRAIGVNALMYLVLGVGLLFVADIVFDYFNFSVELIGVQLMTLYLVVCFLESNHGIAAHFLLTKNEVPFFVASILSGLLTVLLLYIFLEIFNLGLIALVIAPGLAQLLYQNWRWPYLVWKDLAS